MLAVDLEFIYLNICVNGKRNILMFKSKKKYKEMFVLNVFIIINNVNSWHTWPRRQFLSNNPGEEKKKRKE